MKKLLITTSMILFIFGIFDSVSISPLLKNDNSSSNNFRNTLLGQAGNSSPDTVSTDFSFNKNSQVLPPAVQEIQGRDELIKLSEDIRQKASKIKNLKFDPSFIHDEKFKKLVELDIILPEPAIIGVPNPFLDIKYRKNNSLKNTQSVADPLKPELANIQNPSLDPSSKIDEIPVAPKKEEGDDVLTDIVSEKTTSKIIKNITALSKNKKLEKADFTIERVVKKDEALTTLDDEFYKKIQKDDFIVTFDSEKKEFIYRISTNKIINSRDLE